MTTLTDFDQFTDLRGKPEDRPVFSLDLRSELKATIEDALAVIPPTTGDPLKITKSDVTKVLKCEGRYQAEEPFGWTRPTAKGTLVHKALEVACGPTGYQPPDNLVQIALARFKKGGLDGSISEYFGQIDREEFEEIRQEAVADVESYLNLFPPLKDSWNPSAEVWSSVAFANKGIKCNGKIDLRLGSTKGTTSSTLLIDFKTGKPTYDDMQELRFYGLLETLSYPKPPFRWANVYLGNGHIMHEDVSEEMLWVTAGRLIEATLKIAALSEGKEAELTPGDACRFCPAAETCEGAVA